MANKWIKHVMAVRRSTGGRGKSFKEILKLAKKTYKRSPSVGKKKHRTRKHKRTHHRRKRHTRKHHTRKHKRRRRRRRRRR